MISNRFRRGMGLPADGGYRYTPGDGAGSGTSSSSSSSSGAAAAKQSGLQTLGPIDNRTIVRASNPAVNYPAPGAARVDVLTYQVPAGYRLEIQYLAIVTLGGTAVDYTGNVIWRVLVNGAAVVGLDRVLAQMGSNAQPQPIKILLTENDFFEVTVEIPAGKPVNAETTAAKFQGQQTPIGSK